MRSQTRLSLVGVLCVLFMFAQGCAQGTLWESLAALSRARIRANEASAASSLVTITRAQVKYAGTYLLGFAGSLLHLGPLRPDCATVSSSCADLLESVLSGVTPESVSPVKNGYSFIYSAPSGTPTLAAPNATFSVVAIPVTPGSTGVPTFCVDQIMLVIKDSSGTMTAAEPTGCNWPIGGTIGLM